MREKILLDPHPNKFTNKSLYHSKGNKLHE